MDDNIERKPEDLAYLAGYIDADGTIGLRYLKTRNEYMPVLSIAQARRDILEELQAIAGVGGYIWTGENKKGSGFLISRLQYSYQKAGQVCSLALPYLRLKGAQAVIIIQICEWRIKYNHSNVADRDAYFIPRHEEMKRLNAANKSRKIR